MLDFVLTVSYVHLDHLVFGSYLEIEFEDFRFCSATLNRYLVIGNIQLQYDCFGQIIL